MLIDDTLSRRCFPFVAAVSVFLVSTVMVMLGPILVPVAADLHTSLAVAGQLVTVTSMVWGFAAIPVGPISDTYGRRRVLLTGLALIAIALFAGALATSYGAMFAARLLTGIAAAMVPPTFYAACADFFEPAQAGRMLAWPMAGGLLGGALGMPLVAWVANLGTWHTSFIVLGAGMAVLWLIVWASFPRSAPAHRRNTKLLSHFRELGANGRSFWMLPAANFLLQSASWGTLSYLPAYLMKTYQLGMGDVAAPLVVNGIGIMSGALAGGPLANHPRRNLIAVCALPLAGLLLAAAFRVHASVWFTVLLTAAAGALFVLAQPMLLSLVMRRAGAARGTATGIFALSTQMGAMSGAALGGALLALGDFGAVGSGCLATAVAAALLVRQALHEPADIRHI